MIGQGVFGLGFSSGSGVVTKLSKYVVVGYR